MEQVWKDNWGETRRHFEGFWNREDLILGMFGCGLDTGEAVHADVRDPGQPPDLFSRHMDPDWVSRTQEFELSRRQYPADTLPIAYSDLGTVTLATFLGTTPEFAESNVWYYPADLSPDNDRRLTLDPENEWWQRIVAVVEANVHRAAGRYLCGMPSIAPNLDVLAELRGHETVLLDLVENPDWVKAKLAEINQVYFDAYRRLYDRIRLPDGSSVFHWFMIWGPGMVSQTQCDTACMISPAMFEEFVIPPLREVCRWLDHSLYHVDGPDALGTIDPLLDVCELDVIEFTPGPQVPEGGDPSWYPLYRKILDAGKCVQVAGVRAEEVIPLLDAIGGKGVYVLGSYDSVDELERLAIRTEQYR